VVGAWDGAGGLTKKFRRLLNILARQGRAGALGGTKKIFIGLWGVYPIL